MVFVGYTTASFVTYIHLRLPAFARYSRELLTRYSKALPKDATIDITTMNFVGRPRVTRMKVSDLHLTQGRLGIANYARETKELNSKRKWWMGRVVGQFGIRSGKGRTRAQGIWENIEKSIQKRE